MGMLRHPRSVQWLGLVQGAQVKLRWRAQEQGAAGAPRVSM